MIRLFSKLLTIIIGLLLVNLTIAFTVKSSKELYWETNRFSGKKIIALGDSHPMDAFRQNQSTPIAEYCWMGDTYENIYTRLKYLEEIGQLKHIEMVILTADPYMFTDYRSRPLDELTSSAPTWSDIWFPLFLNKYVSKDLLRALKRRDNLKLMTPIPFCGESDNMTGAEVAKRFDNQYNEASKLHPQMIKAFESSLALLKKHSIKIIAIKFPASNSYVISLNKSNVYKIRNDFSDSIFNSNNIKVFDFRSALSTAHFKNTDHLTCEGSTMFINMLSDSIKLNK